MAIPVETRPGEVAQVDFGYVGRLPDPRTHVLRKAWVFVLVLGYSRHMFSSIAAADLPGSAAAPPSYPK